MWTEDEASEEEVEDMKPELKDGRSDLEKDFLDPKRRSGLSLAIFISFMAADLGGDRPGAGGATGESNAERKKKGETVGE